MTRERNHYWTGILIGTLAGAAITALIRADLLATLLQGRRRGPADLLQFPSSTQRADTLIPFGSPMIREDEGSLHLRRENPESAGSLATVAPETTDRNRTALERPGGAPGSRSGTENMSVPGYPGQTTDLSDPTRPVHPSSRSIDLQQS